MYFECVKPGFSNQHGEEKAAMPNCWQEKNGFLGFPNLVGSGTTQTQPGRSSPHTHHSSVKWIDLEPSFPLLLRTSVCQSCQDFGVVAKLPLPKSTVGPSDTTPALLRRDLSLPSVPWKVGLVLPSFLPTLPDSKGDKGEGHQRQGTSHLCSVLMQKEQRCHWAVTHLSVHWHKAP